MDTVSFKERVKNEAISNVKIYKENFVDYEYLVCSEALKNKCQIIKCDEGNYAHLIGIHTNLSPAEFYDKCYNGTLLETDFDFAKPGKSEKSVKGSVREKIQSLPYMVNLFKQELLAENDFKKNRIECAFATSDLKCTLGFAVSGRPMSLLKGNQLDMSKAQKVDLIFRKLRGSEYQYSDLYFGDITNIIKYKENISHMITKTFLE